MKRIIIYTIFTIAISTVSVFASCPIDNVDYCKADIGAGINDKLQEKIVPDNLKQLTQPNNTFNGRTNLGQPQIPSNIKMEPQQEENTQPYNANCQFGNCINRGESGSNVDK